MEKIIVKVRPTMEKSFNKAIEKFNKAIAKAGENIVPAFIGECNINISIDGNTFQIKGKEYEVQIPDSIMKLKDYRLIGDYVKMEGKWYRTMYSEEIKDELEVNENNLRCDHCHKNIKNRNEYYFFRDKDGKLVVVGSTCVNDFMGFNAKEILSKMGDIANFTNENHRSMPDFDKEYVSVQINDFIEIVKNFTENFTKWVKGVSSKEIKENIKQVFYGKQELAHNDYFDIINEVRNYWNGKIDFDDFTVNTRESIKDDFVPVKWAGIAGFGVYKVQAIKNGSMTEKKPGNYVGNIGESITKDLNVKRTFSFPSKFKRNELVYGIEFRDNDNNSYITFTSSKDLICKVKNGMNTLKANFIIAEQNFDKGIKVNKIKNIKLV